MATGFEIKEVYDMMKRIYVETSKLLIVINDMFEKEGFQAVGDNTVMWGKSNHYRYPEYWTPYFMQRVFVKEKGSKMGIGINIMFDGSVDGLENKIPFVTCGLLEFQYEKAVKGNALYLAGWTDESEGKRQMDGPICTDDFTESGVMVTSYFLPLDILNNQQKVNQLIIQPLIHLFNGERDDACCLIEEAAIGLEEIMGLEQPRSEKVKSGRVKITIYKNGELLKECASIQEAGRVLKNDSRDKNFRFAHIERGYIYGESWSFNGATYTFKADEKVKSKRKAELEGK